MVDPCLWLAEEVAGGVVEFAHFREGTVELGTHVAQHAAENRLGQGRTAKRAEKIHKNPFDNRL